jgi:hypothetical protein
MEEIEGNGKAVQTEKDFVHNKAISTTGPWSQQLELSHWILLPLEPVLSGTLHH